MTFGAWSLGVVVAGVAALAAGLFLLQQLRTRYRDVTVVTTLFWKQVSHEAPVRTLRERFRHPLAYLLVLAIASLLWLALGDPQWGTSAEDERVVIVVDGSAGMGRGDRLSTALSQARALAEALPRDRRSVVWAGATLRPLLAPGEDALLLDARTSDRTADAAPPSVADAVRTLTSVGTGTGRVRVIVVGDAPVGADVVSSLPEGVTVSRAARVEPPTANVGITALGAADAVSGVWDRVDVYLAVERAAGAATGALTLTLDGQPVPPSSIERSMLSTGNGEAVRVRDVPAAGGVFEARLEGDALAADDRASLRLPRKPRLRVQVSSSVASVVEPVLSVDNGTELVDSTPDVVIRRAGETTGGAVPALEFVDIESQPSAFVLTHPATVEAGDALTAAVDNIGLRHIDGTSLADQIGRPIEVSVQAGAGWRFSVWAPLMTDEFNFTRSRAFPVFVANAVRWLAQVEAWAPYVAAGRPLRVSEGTVPPVLLSAQGRRLDGAGLALVPPAAGALTREGAEPLAVSLLAPGVTHGTGEDVLPVDTAVGPVSAGRSLMWWLVIGALLLLAGEWHLYQRGRMP